MSEKSSIFYYIYWFTGYLTKVGSGSSQILKKKHFWSGSVIQDPDPLIYGSTTLLSRIWGWGGAQLMMRITNNSFTLLEITIGQDKIYTAGRTQWIVINRTRSPEVLRHAWRMRSRHSPRRRIWDSPLVWRFAPVRPSVEGRIQCFLTGQGASTDP
jgi:hypothetical protein